jgi:hypothetical protein
MRKYFVFFTLGLLLCIGAAYLQATGNLAPNGPHYDLNIIGVDHNKTITMSGSNRHTIFVPLFTAPDGELDTVTSDSAPIVLVQGPFEVCQGNASAPPVLCPGSAFIGNLPALGAVFQLPCNSLNTLGLITPCTSTGPGSVASYEVWGRVVGIPNGSGTITLCAVDSTNTPVCNTDATVSFKNSAHKFTDLTKTLTTLTTAAGNVPLFAAGFSGWFWDYDNAGNKVLQLRFYLI